MTIFLIQTIDNLVKHDFSFQLLEAIDYFNWKNVSNKTFDFVFCNKLDDLVIHYTKNHIPVGTVEFFLEFMEKAHGIKDIKPINIPEELQTEEFLKRKIWTVYDSINNAYKNMSYDKLLFCKSMERIKTPIYTDYFHTFRLKHPKEKYLLSEIIEIQSEYRCFVHNGELVGIQNYSGDFTIFPTIQIINKMIKTYKHCPGSYTLDVAITNKHETVVIEVHNFFSCGLYGFSEHKYLPYMFINGFMEVLKLKETT